MGATTPTVLVIDDDDATRYSVTRILQKGGFTVREGVNGAEGLRLSAMMPDLIILDVKLPDISGFEVCRRIKADPATANIPVLHLSATFVDIEDKVQGLEGGADGYLTNTLEPVELLATVKALLRARRAEEAAGTSNRQWHATFDAVNDGVLLLDPDGTILQMNQAMERILGGTWSEILQKSFHEIMGFDEDLEHSPFLRAELSRSREVAELTRGDRWLHAAVDPVQDIEGAFKGALCIVSDVTERRRMEEELRRRAESLAVADRRKDEFLAMLAHELRNPLAPILTCIELIRREVPREPKLRQPIEIVERQVKHMARLLDDLLDVSRFIQGKIQLRRVPMDFLAVVSHAVETSSLLINAKRHHLAVDLPAGPLPMNGDPTRLEQVVANLLNNAAKYTEPGGRIALSVRRERGEMVMVVEDSGVGMTPEMMGRVFDLFAQADLSLDRTRGGLGIGLTLVQRLLELHGGSVEVHSRGLGMGSRFVLRLPLSEARVESLPEPAAPSRVEPLRLLIVDDQKDLAISLARLISFWGHEADVAHDGPSAIEAVAAGSYDAVLLDIGLPGMDGYEVAERVRRLEGGDALLLVALTGYCQEEDQRRSREAGFDRHLIKPVSPETIQELFTHPVLAGDRSRLAPGRSSP